MFNSNSTNSRKFIFNLVETDDDYMKVYNQRQYDTFSEAFDFGLPQGPSKYYRLHGEYLPNDKNNFFKINYKSFNLDKIIDQYEYCIKIHDIVYIYIDQVTMDSINDCVYDVTRLAAYCNKEKK